MQWWCFVTCSSLLPYLEHPRYIVQHKFRNTCPPNTSFEPCALPTTLQLPAAKAGGCRSAGSVEGPHSQAAAGAAAARSSTHPGRKKYDVIYGRTSCCLLPPLQVHEQKLRLVVTTLTPPSPLTHSHTQSLSHTHTHTFRTMQAAWRGHCVRQQVACMHVAAATIQAHWWGMVVRER